MAAATDTHTLPPARRCLTPCEPRTKGESIWHGPLGSAGRTCVLSAVRTAHRRRDGLTHSLALSPPPCLSPPPPCCARTAAVSGEERSRSPSAARKTSVRTTADGRSLVVQPRARAKVLSGPSAAEPARASHRVACCLDVWRPAAGCGNEPTACVCQKPGGGMSPIGRRLDENLKCGIDAFLAAPTRSDSRVWVLFGRRRSKINSGSLAWLASKPRLRSVLQLGPAAATPPLRSRSPQQRGQVQRWWGPGGARAAKGPCVVITIRGQRFSWVEMDWVQSSRRGGSSACERAQFRWWQWWWWCRVPQGGGNWGHPPMLECCPPVWRAQRARIFFCLRRAPTKRGSATTRFATHMFLAKGNQNTQRNCRFVDMCWRRETLLVGG